MECLFLLIGCRGLQIYLKKSLHLLIASFLNLNTFAVLIFEGYKKKLLNAYHSAACEKRKDKIDIQVKVPCPRFITST